MPGKMARSAALPPFGVAGATAVVGIPRLSCQNAGKRKNSGWFGGHLKNPGYYDL